VAGGFALRVGAASLALESRLDAWLLACTFLLCLFVSFAKRANDVVQHGQSGDDAKASADSGYSLRMLRWTLVISGVGAVAAFILYCFRPGPAPGTAGCRYLLGSLPFAIFAVARVASLSLKGTYREHIQLVLRDLPLQIAVALWLLVCTFGMNFAGR